MKTAFDGVPIHIPAEYMFAFDRTTYGNCDNVSGHPLDRVCREVERLRTEYPDRLTLASTGGPVTGDDDLDRTVWQSNTASSRRPAPGHRVQPLLPAGRRRHQGRHRLAGRRADRQDHRLGDGGRRPGGAQAVQAHRRGHLDRPDHRRDQGGLRRATRGTKAGVTLANTFPTLAFRPGAKERWEEGIVVGMSGAGVTPISNLTLAKVSHLGVAVSGNGGPMDYHAAAHFLALGARTVQFCTIVMKYGVGDRRRAALRALAPDGGARHALGRGADRPRAAATRSPASWSCRRPSRSPRVDARAVRALRQLHALPVPGDHARRRQGPGHRPGALHRLLVLHPEVLHRRALDARAHAGGSWRRWSRREAPGGGRGLASDHQRHRRHPGREEPRPARPRRRSARTASITAIAPHGRLDRTARPGASTPAARS